MTVHCVIGYPGSGKGEVANVADEMGYAVVSMGDMVRARAEEALDNPDSDAIGEWATEQREVHGDEVVAEWTAEHIRDMDASDVVIEGMRSKEELAIFERMFDADVTIIHVQAPRETRLERLRDRGRDGEDEFTLEKLQNRDEREDGWGVAELIESTETVDIDNTASLEEFQSAVRNIL